MLFRSGDIVGDKARISTATITEDGWACDESTLVELVGDYGDAGIGKIVE